MISIKEAVIVEGKYDKMQLEKVCDAPIFTTEGFRIFKSAQKREFLKALAKERGILILTDSDRAGFMIRNHIKSFVKEGSVKNAYIPEILGKERRKTRFSKEGKLGVEGIDTKTLESILLKYCREDVPKDKITKTDLYCAGLYGGANSAAARAFICEKISVPTGISANGFIDALNALVTKDKFYEMVGALQCTKDTDND